MTASVDTRRLYAFEARFFRATPQSHTRPMAELRRLAGRVWSGLGRKGCPRVVAGPGVRYLGARYSYCRDGYIQLARNQRNVLTLLHELTHALGHDYHDAAFVKTYRSLLLRYSSITPEILDAGLRAHKLLK
jgi:hypothetical protein